MNIRVIFRQFVKYIKKLRVKLVKQYNFFIFLHVLKNKAR